MNDDPHPHGTVMAGSQHKPHCCKGVATQRSLALLMGASCCSGEVITKLRSRPVFNSRPLNPRMFIAVLLHVEASRHTSQVSRYHNAYRKQSSTLWAFR